MDQPETPPEVPTTKIALTELYPEAKQKGCPYMPLAVTGKDSIGRQKIAMSPCAGEICAIWADCQGTNSPEDRAGESYHWFATLLRILKILVVGLPFIPGDIRDSICQLIHEELDNE